ncbi:purine nucleotide binding protein [Hysterangium stoloniferum]|nr:purine nucleotide binding protein [Hysterangium stoloniferum]
MPPKPAAAGSKDIRAFFTSSQVPTKDSASKSSQVIEISDEESEPVKPKARPRTSAASTSIPKPKPAPKKAKKRILDDDDDDDDDEISTVEPAPKKSKKNAKDDDFIDDGGDEEMSSPSGEDHTEEEEKPKKRKTVKKDPAKKVQARKSIAKTPMEKNVKTGNEDKPQATKPNFAAIAAKRAAGPILPGSKPVPDGQPNCLAGLTFVFTGELTAFSRDEAVDLAKRYGGRVTGQPSGKTSYVVVGGDAGPAKLAAIKKHNLPTLDEDGKGFVDDKTREKMEKEEKKIKEVAKELEKQEKSVKAATGVSPTSQLWTTKYAPQAIKDICGNKGQVEKLQQWLQDWQNSAKASFKKPGKNGMNTFRAVMMTGSPGIGKTTSAHLCARLAGYTPIELNASDARSKKLVENSTNINNTSLDGWMTGKNTTLATGVSVSDKSVLIMDEVDGMSAGDRGGVGALNALIKKTKIPIICIANDRQAQKLKPLMHTTFNLSFKKPDANAVRSRIMSICFREGLKIPANVVDQLIQGAQSDIRQVINMLSTWKLSNETMDFDQGKALAKMNEKYMLMTPWGIMNKILSPYAFSPTSRETLNDKMDLYFQDHAFVPMFMQENYIKVDPMRARQLDGPEKDMKKLELLDNAASSLSDSDLVDTMIHSSEQHWSLMPLHAVTSTVRPAYYMYGNSGFVGPTAISFPVYVLFSVPPLLLVALRTPWFGQNSKHGKLQRQLADIQVRMRLRVSGDKSEIRTSYIPAMHLPLVQPLTDNGSSAVDEVIECMDEYYLSKEDWDTIVELGVGESKDDKILKNISAATKTAFTKKYNTMDHPIAFHKSADLGKVPKKLAGGPMPDLEEAFDLDEPEEEEKEDIKPKDPTGIANDKLLKVGGKGKASKGKAKVVKK